MPNTNLSSDREYTDHLAFLAAAIQEINQRAKRASEPTIRKLLYYFKTQLCDLSILRYSRSVKTKYHAHRKGPLVFLQFDLGEKQPGVHVFFEHLSGEAQYRTHRLLGNAYVFNRNVLNDNTTSTYKS